MSKQYVGMGWDRNGVIRISINLARFKNIASKAIQEGKKSVTLYVAKRRQKGKYDDDYSVYEFTPDNNYQRNYQQPRKQSQPRQQSWQQEPAQRQYQQPPQDDGLDYNANANTNLSNELGW